MSVTPKRATLKGGREVWRVNFRPGRNTNPTTETFDTFDEAMKFCRLIDRVGGAAARQLRDMSDESAIEAPTVATAIEQHIEAVASHATPGTLHRYQQIARDRINPTLGDMPADMLTRRTVEKWVTALRRETTRDGKPLSAKTIKNAQALLSAALQRQVDDGAITRNVAKGIPLPKDTIGREKVFLTPQQVEALISAMPDRYRPLTRFLYLTGARFGEATALTVADLDLDSYPATARISKAWKEAKQPGQPVYLGTPKTRRSVRTVSLPDNILPTLRVLTDGKPPSELVFTSSRGGRISSATFHSEAWQKAVKMTGMDPAPRVHDLRHSHASALIAAGIPLPVIQRRLGHESIQTTVDVYGHLAPDAAVQVADAIQAMSAPNVAGEITA